MILNARQNGFYLDLPIDFFSPEISKKYEKYYSSLVLPYPTIFDFMSSTIQAVNFPGFDSTLLTQTRPYGKKQDIQSSIPIEDQFSKRLEITFKLTDAYLNYFIFRFHINIPSRFSVAWKHQYYEYLRLHLQFD